MQYQKLPSEGEVCLLRMRDSFMCFIVMTHPFKPPTSLSMSRVVLIMCVIWGPVSQKKFSSVIINTALIFVLYSGKYSRINASIMIVVCSSFILLLAFTLNCTTQVQNVFKKIEIKRLDFF